MKLESVAERLETLAVGTRGQGIFINFMPAASVGVLLRFPMAGTPIDHELPGYLKTSFQLITRGKDFAATKALIEQAVAALTVEETDLTGMHVNYMRPRHEPIPFPGSQGNNLEFVVNIDCCYILT